MHDFPQNTGPDDARRNRLLLGSDIRVRMILTMAAIIAVVASTRTCLGLAALAGSLLALAWSGAPLGVILRRMIGPLALAMLVLVAKTLLTGTTPLAEFDLGMFRLTATREGLAAGGLIASRILGSLSLLMLLCHGASMEELAAALRWARLPQAWIEIALLMHRYLHIFADQAACVVAAQRVRLGYGNLRRSLESVGAAAGIVLLRSLDQAQRSHEAMLARGYRGAFPLPALPPLSRAQNVVAGLGIAAIVALLALAERWCP